MYPNERQVWYYPSPTHPTPPNPTRIKDNKAEVGRSARDWKSGLTSTVDPTCCIVFCITSSAKPSLVYHRRNCGELSVSDRWSKLINFTSFIPSRCNLPKVRCCKLVGNVVVSKFWLQRPWKLIHKRLTANGHKSKMQKKIQQRDGGYRYIAGWMAKLINASACHDLLTSVQNWGAFSLPYKLPLIIGRMSVDLKKTQHSTHIRVQELWNLSDCRLLGQRMFSKFCRKCGPKVRLLMLSGHKTCSKFWLNWNPKVRLCKPLGQLTCWRLWLNVVPHSRCCNLEGRVISFGSLLYNRFWDITMIEFAKAPGKTNTFSKFSPMGKLKSTLNKSR